MSNPAQFTVDLAKVIAKAKGNGVRVVKATSLALEAGVKTATPADTGAARNRWSIGLNAMDNAEYPADKSGQGATARNVGKLSQFRMGDAVFITNNIPYIYKLEYGLYGNPEGSANGPKTINGYSTQAPGGFVRITYQNVLSQIPRIVAGATK